MDCSTLEFQEIRELDKESMNLENLGSMINPTFWKNLTTDLINK